MVVIVLLLPVLLGLMLFGLDAFESLLFPTPSELLTEDDLAVNECGLGPTQ